MIKGKKINLRLMLEQDLDLYCDLTNNFSEVGDHFPVIVRTPSDTRKIFYETGFFDISSGRMLIVNKEDRVLGFVSYFRTAGYVSGYELGYQIFRTDDRGKGYTSEALKLFSAYLFELYPITRLQICMEKENVASEHVAIKCGFTFEGQMRAAWVVRGKLITNQVYSMIRSEAPRLKSLL